MLARILMPVASNLPKVNIFCALVRQRCMILLHGRDLHNWDLWPQMRRAFLAAFPLPAFLDKQLSRSWLDMGDQFLSHQNLQTCHH